MLRLVERPRERGEENGPWVHSLLDSFLHTKYEKKEHTYTHTNVTEKKTNQQ